MELTSPSESVRVSLTVVFGILIVVSLLVNILLIAGSAVGEDYDFKLHTINTQITALLVNLVSLPLTILHLQPVTLTDTDCLIVSCLQILSLILYDINLLFSSTFWNIEMHDPGFNSRNRNFISFGRFLSWIIPVSFVSISTGLILHYQDTNETQIYNSVEWNSTISINFCDWSVFPVWFPSVCVYGVFIPYSVYAFCLYVAVLKFAGEKVRVTQSQSTAVATNSRTLASDKRHKFPRKRQITTVILACLHGLLVLAPHGLVNLAMLYNEVRLVDPLVLHSIWSGICWLGTFCQSFGLLIMTVNIRKGLKTIYFKLWK